MFHAWMHWADPPLVTGLSDDPEAQQLWRDVFDYMGGEVSEDAEFLFAAGLMAELFPYVLGDEGEWAARGSLMKQRALSLQSTALPVSVFQDRGGYGEYFTHQLRSHRA